MPSPFFKNQTVLITGASMGIGREIALAFAQEGAELVLVARSQDKLEQVAKAVRALGAKAHVFPADLTQTDSLTALVEKIFSKFPSGLHILVNNAGKGLYALLEKAPEKEVRSLFELNVFVPLLLTQKLIPLLQKTKGQIINISSVAGHLSVPKMGIYSASKFALNAWGKALRVELKPQGISVTHVYPGLTNTDFSENAANINGRPTAFRTKGKGISAAFVAQRVLQAARKRKRDEFVLFQNRLLVWAHFYFPKLFDLIFSRFIR